MDLKNINVAIDQIAAEKNLDKEIVVQAVKDSLASAYKKEYRQKGEMIRCEFDTVSGEMQFWQIKNVVEPSMLKTEEEIAAEENGGEENDIENLKIKFNPDRHILLEEAKQYEPDVTVGETIAFNLPPADEGFSRIAAQTAKQVILQKLHEAEKESVLSNFKGLEETLISGVIQRIEGSNIYIDLGKATGILFAKEAIPHEKLRVGQRKKFMILNIEDRMQGPSVLLTRLGNKFITLLFESEVPEIKEGLVIIKSLAREPGERTKLAVTANEGGIDPIGACVGQKGTRIATVIEELGGEKIDIIEYSEEPGKYVAQALNPAEVKEFEILPNEREVRVYVPQDQISLAIGRGGQNVRLAAKLTGWRIDVRSLTTPDQEINGGQSNNEEGGEESEAKEKLAKPVEPTTNIEEGEVKEKSEEPTEGPATLAE
ncbi:MAG: transcription termination factor NusA [Candidatus Parcubacteria bacterium]|nr:transcription termination factor NusA [Candidatus Parcubacteria bacterium]